MLIYVMIQSIYWKYSVSTKDINITCRVVFNVITELALCNVCSEQLLKLAANNFHSLLTGFSEKRKKANTHNTLNNYMTEWCLQILWILQTVHRFSSLSVSIGWVNVLVVLEWILVGIANRMLIHSNCKWHPKTAVHLHLPA